MPPRAAGRGGPYLVDTNLYVQAFRNADFGEAFRAFYAAVLPRLVVSVVVLFELYAGARDTGARRAIDRGVLQPFRARHRVLLPDLETWTLAADVLRDLRQLGGHDARLAQRSFQNDVLIAASCRRAGATLLTANARDFALIREVLGFRFETSFPDAG